MTDIYSKFSEVMYDNDLHNYINGHIIVKSKDLNTKDDVNSITKNIIIDYYLWKNKIDKNENKIYSKLYDELLKENKITINKKNKINKDLYVDRSEEEKEEKEEQEYEEDKRLHYQSYFGRYKDLIYIIDYYKRMKEEEENKVYSFEEDTSDNEYIEEDEYYDDYYEDYYSDYENYDYEEEEDNE